MAVNRAGGSGPWSNWPFSEFLRYWDFRPTTSWFQHFITINNNAGDAGVEQTVLGEVGSYGYQIGRLIDAVKVVVDELEKPQGVDKLTPDQRQAIANFRQLAADVDRSVSGYWTHQQ